MGLDLYLAYVFACVLVAVLKHGTRAGLLNVAGTQLGLALMTGCATPARSASSGWAGSSCVRRMPLQGFLVLMANPKALLSDGAYAVLTGRAGALLSRRRMRLVSRISGSCLIGGGIWLALTRAR